ncbi:MAG TPA: NADH-ubiquinone oxidoreductase-F iron-sulfur binding region domain-containing protein [Jatrophihabitans sp.]|nr:NADH-ubiquinone oxidoreductase-F iron-sulfur binding region domain-containing protein [Jatrophihabitans sp.]
MTAVLNSQRLVPVGYVGTPRLLRALDLLDPAEHLAAHGPLPVLDRAGLLGLLGAAPLAGRGGAGFPLAAKVRGLRAGPAPVVVVNGAEGEPVSAKDRALLGRAPHLVLDGAQLLAGAVGARSILVAVGDPALAGLLERVLAGRPRVSKLDVEVREVPDRFVTGEARALVSALNGGAALPPGRRVLPTEHGVGGRPTLVCNTETLAQLAVLARIGPAAFAATGTRGEPGTTLLTVTGAVANPGVLEVPLGTRLGDVAAAVGAQPSQAVVIGGYHGMWLRPAPKLELSRAGLARDGGTLGAGVVIFVGERTCPLGELTRVAGWLAGESARQCGPCTFGLPALAGELRRLAGGTPVKRNALRMADLVTGRGACAHPDGAARFIRSALGQLTEELQLHQAYGSCRRSDLGQLATTRTVW